MRTSYKFSIVGSLAVCGSIISAFGDVGSNNPTGTAGRFGEVITTGCAYLPFTANATRSVTDLTVSNGVSSYPLAFTRTLSSRYTAGLNAEFGQAGNWMHSYSWSIDPQTITSGSANSTPGSYTVHYPDGGTVIFRPAPSGNGDPDFRGPIGVRDRFEQITKMTTVSSGNGTTTKYADVYLRLPDGGKVWFTVNITTTVDSSGGGGGGGPPCVPRCQSPDSTSTTYDSDFTFYLAGIIDPYGQKTTIRAPGDGTVVITEPAGRMLQIFYGTGPAGDYVITKVQEWMGNNNGTPQWPGRAVTYNYAQIPGTAYSALSRVDYPHGFSAYYGYQASDNTNGSSRQMIKWCVDPMYPGPMWAIGYTFVPSSSGAVYGQLQSENYCNPSTAAIGPAVSTLSVTGTNTRTETRGDGPTRTFNFGSTTQSGFTVPASYLLGNLTDFNGANLYKSYDANGFVNAIKDRNGNITNYQNDPWTGNTTLITYPLTPSDTALGLGRATSATSYTGSGSDPNNPYYVYGYTNQTRWGRRHGWSGRHARTHKRGLAATYVRDGNKRITTINYPDGGTESFTYNNFGQALTHRLKAGGLETYTYDWRGMLAEYRDAYHQSSADPQNPNVPTNQTPSIAYAYYGLDWVKTITDARNNTTTFTYNNRGQLLTATPPGAAHPITNTYNPNGNGTLVSLMNELQHTTSYGYDDYKRLTSVTLPPPSGGPSPSPTTTSYDHNGGTGADYTHCDPNPTRVTLPSSKITKTVYDNNLRKSSVTVGYGTGDAATSGFIYDSNGNLKKVTDPKQNVTQNYYDQQNRLTDVDDPMVNDATTPHKNSNGHTISYIYDQANNVHTKLNANNQLLSYAYDSMNHVTQVTAPQTPDPTAITKYTYYTTGLSSGLLHTMQDPHLTQINSSAVYTYSYDLVGRKTNLAYPPADSNSSAKNESWSYDTAGNVGTFTNRAGNVQTFSYDSRERPTGFIWNDGATPSETIVYGDGLHITQISNSNATINNNYFDDDTLKSQEEWAVAEGVHRTVSYTYDSDLNRATIAYPNSHSFSYGYTNRDQVDSIYDSTESNYPVTYLYDGDGNIYSETEDGVVTTTATFNAMNLVKNLSRGFAGTTKTFDYGYDVMSDRTSIQQDGGAAKLEAYDLAEQSTTETINGTATTFDYDANGNRTGVNGTGSYGTNNLNEYTTFNGIAVSYDANGNLATYNGWTYNYDAQNRMTSASNGSTTETFKYDGLNRQISHALNGATTYNVWDGWNLIEEFAPGGSVPTSVYVYGARGEIVERMSGGATILYFQDALGNTSHVSDSGGHLLESYTYSRTGTPTFYNNSGGQISASAYSIRHLFQGQLWTQTTGLNDYRNRMQLPAMGIFMQADPSGFGGDPTNLYRFCGNNPINWADPTGLEVITRINGAAQLDHPVIVTGSPILDTPGQEQGPGLSEFNDPSLTLGNRDFSPSLREFGDRSDITGGKGLPSSPSLPPNALPPALPPNPFNGPAPTPTPTASPIISPNAGVTPFPQDFFYVPTPTASPTLTPTPAPTPDPMAALKAAFDQLAGTPTPTAFPGSYPAIFPSPTFPPPIMTPTPVPTPFEFPIFLDQN